MSRCRGALVRDHDESPSSLLHVDHVGAEGKRNRSNRITGGKKRLESKNMGLTSDQIHDVIKERFGDVVTDDQRDVVDPFLVVKPESIEDLARFARDDDRLDFDLLSLIAGVDYPDRQTIEVVYCLDSTARKHRLIIKAPLPRDNPRIRTLEGVWKTADWHERETFDLVGVIFEGHHNLVRILCAEDWEGHPLRKDYVIPESYRGLKNVVY